MNSCLNRSEWLRTLDWFILSALVIVIVARSNGLIGFQAQDDNHFISFLVVCIFAAIIVDIVGSVLWMVFTIFTDPFVLEPDEVSQSKFLESPTNYKEKRGTLSLKDFKKKEDALSAKRVDAKRITKDDKQNMKSASAPHLNRGGKKETSALAVTNKNAAAETSPPSSPFMKISPFQQQARDCQKAGNDGDKDDGNNCTHNNINNHSNVDGNNGDVQDDSNEAGVQTIGCARGGEAWASKSAVVLDIGCTWMRFGLAGQGQPQIVLDSAKVIDAVTAKSSAISGDTSRRAQPAVLFNEDGSVGDWHLVLGVVQYLYGQAREKISLQAQPVLVCWPPTAPAEDAVKLASLLLRRLVVPALYVAPSPLLALYASGRNSGCCVLSGEQCTSVMCFRNGILLEDSVRTSPLAGRFVTGNLQKKMSGGALGGRELGVHSIREFKEKIVSCARTRQSAKTRPDVIPGTLASDRDSDPAPPPLAGGLPLSMEERQQCAEGLFRRRGGLVAGEEIVEPLQQMIVSSIAAVSERTNASEFWGNLVVAGGNSKLTHFKERLLSELESIEMNLGSEGKLKLEEPSGDAAEAVWLGGSVLSSTDFGNHWLRNEADVIASLQM